MNSNHPIHKKEKRNPDYYREGILSKNKFILAEAITLVESKSEDKKELAENLLNWAYSVQQNQSLRIAVTGSPGSGKSTFIDSLGVALVNKGHHVAVLTIDPSSTISKGSILGDKTRMETLTRLEKVFVRPSPSGSILGGVAPHTKEAILLCEAAGYDRILIETVGIGQSETDVSALSDVSVFILQPGAGDDLQGVKRGIIENIDIAIVNKSDGVQQDLARETARNYQQSLGLFHHPVNDWKIPVLLVSSIEKKGIDKVIQAISDFEKLIKDSEYFLTRRTDQEKLWFQNQIPIVLLEEVMSHSKVEEAIQKLEKKLQKKESNAVLALRECRKIFQKLYVKK